VYISRFTIPSILLVFTARRYASAECAVLVCPSVCPSKVGVLLKRLNEGSRKYDNPVTPSFAISRISTKFEQGHSEQGAKCR